MASEHLRLLLSETHPKITTYHAQAEHKPRHAEGPFFANLLEAVGYPEPDSGSNPTKRMRLINKIKEACSRNGSGTVVPFCDEAQRYDENEYEWLRDVHDHLDRLQIRLFTFLVGQQVEMKDVDVLVLTGKSGLRQVVPDTAATR